MREFGPSNHQTAKGEVVSVRMPGIERDKIEAVAHFHGMSLSEFAREKVVEAAYAEVQRVGVETIIDTLEAQKQRIIAEVDERIDFMRNLFPSSDQPTE